VGKRFRNFAKKRNPWALGVWGIVILLGCVLGSSAQQRSWRVFFLDKGPEPFSIGSPLYEQTLRLHTPRALVRRAWVRGGDSLLTLADAPVYEPYIDSLRRLGASVRLRVRWNNYVVVEADSVIVERLRGLPFVAAVQPTHQVPLPRTRVRVTSGERGSGGETLPVVCGELDYGASWRQVQMLEVPFLHRMGFTGDSVLVGLLDTGFRWRGHPAFEHIAVVAEWDFLQGDSVTANEGTEHPLQDTHGTMVLSVVGAFWPGQLIGVAPMARYILAKTEDISRERHVEEDAYAAAIEWMEALGVDVISSSLGYRDFDSLEVSYTTEQLDGRTTIVARAVTMAAQRGVICVTAMGNDGRRGLVSPADADSVVAVAAVDSTEQWAPFSSVGFRQRGVLRPTVAAMGVSVVAAGPRGQWVRASGTSLATPLVAGTLALLIGARPDVPPWRIRQALLETASRARAPDTLVGYGVPRAAQALASLGGALGTPAVWKLPSGAIRVACYGFIPFRSFHAWLQWAAQPREDAVEGYLLMRVTGDNGMPLLYGDLPGVLLQRGQPVWIQVWVESAEGKKLSSRWYVLPQQPSFPCGVEIPESVLHGGEDQGRTVQILPHPVMAGQECVARVPGIYPGSQQPLSSVCLWDMTGRLVECVSLLPERLGQVPEWTVRLPTARLSPGLYWVEATYGKAERLGAPLILY